MVGFACYKQIMNLEVNFHSRLSCGGSTQFGDAHSRRRFTHLFFLLNGLDRLMDENGWLEYLGWISSLIEANQQFISLYVVKA